MGFFKKSHPKSGTLEQAKTLGLISEEEFLRLKIERAERKYKRYLDKMKIKKKR